MSRTSGSCVQPSPAGGSLVRADAARPRRPGRTRPGCGGPTTAGARCTSRACCRPSRSSASTCPSGWICDAAVADGVAGGLGQRADLDEPLQRQARLDGGLAARAVADGVHVRALLGDDAALLAQRADDRRSGPRSGPGPGRGRATVITPRSSMIVMDGRSWRWPISKSFGSCAGVTLTAPVPNSGSTCSSATTGMVRSVSGSLICLPTRCGVPLVVGVHGDGGVTEHRLGAGRRDDEAVLALAVADGDELAVVVLVLDLDVGERRQAARAPVDDALGAVDQPVVVEPLEDGLDGAGQALVHREALAASSRRRRRGGASGRGSCRRTPPSTARRARRTPRGRGRGGTCPPSASCCSTSFCVAMPAWSMPGSHSAS